MIDVCVLCMVNRPELSPLSAEHRTLLEVIVSPVINTADCQAFPCQWLMCETCKLSMQIVYNFQQSALVGVKNLLLYLKTRQNETIEETKPMEFVKVEAPPEVSTAASKNNIIAIEAPKNVKLLTEELLVKFEPEHPDFEHEPKDEPDRDTISANHEPDRERDTVSANHESDRDTMSANHEPDRETMSAKHEPDRERDTVSANHESDRDTMSANHEPDRETMSAKHEPDRERDTVSANHESDRDTMSANHEPDRETMSAKHEPDRERDTVSANHEPDHTQPYSQDGQQVTVAQQVRVRNMHQMRAPNTQQIPVPYIEPVRVPNIHEVPVPYIQPFRVPNIHQDRVSYIQPIRVPNIHQDRVPYILPFRVPNIHQDRVPYIQPVRVPNIHQFPVPYIQPVQLPNIQPVQLPNIHHQFQAPLPSTQQARVMPVGAESEGNFEVFTHQPQPENMTNYNYENGVLTCPRCGRVLMNKSAYVSHMKGHENRERQGPNPVRKKYKRKKPERVTCPLCDKSFGNNCSLKGHMTRSHGEISLCECDVCGKQYRNEFALKLHKYHHTKKEIQANRDPMETMRPELFCKECCLQFPGPAAYRQHLMTRKHTPKEHYKFECTSCSAKFVDERRLQQHVEVVHLRQGTYKCDKCDRSYGTEKSLRHHIIYVHEKLPKSKPTLICHLCGKKFTIRKSLKEHLLKHEGLRPHQCALCPATFTYGAALYTHNRLKHLKIKRKKKKKEKEGEERAESYDSDGVKIKRKRKKKVKDGEEKSADSGDGDGVKIKRKKDEKYGEEEEEKNAERYECDGVGELLKII